MSQLGAISQRYDKVGRTLVGRSWFTELSHLFPMHNTSLIHLSILLLSSVIILARLTSVKNCSSLQHLAVNKNRSKYGSQKVNKSITNDVILRHPHTEWPKKCPKHLHALCSEVV